MAFVVKRGSVVPVRPTNASLMSLPAYTQIGAGTFQTYQYMWKTQPALRTVIEFLARNVAELSLDVFQRTSDTDRKKLQDHPLNKLLNTPWPGSSWTKYRLLNWTVQEYSIFNSALWIKTKARGEHGIMPIPRHMVQPVGDNPLYVEGWRVAGGKRDLKPDEVVHFAGYNPDSTRDGWPPVETLRQVLAEEYASGQYREQMWRNGARISGYITRGEKAPRWSPEGRDRFKAEWRTYSDEMAAGGTPVLEDGMQWHEGGISPKDAQYIEARQLTREEVAIAYHVNPAMLGMNTARATDMAELHQMMYADTLGPLLEMISQDIEMQLLPDLEPTDSSKIYVEFNLRKKLQGSFEAQAAAISASVGGPWMKRNEGRALYNLPEVPDGDELIVPMNVTEGGLASPRDTAPDNPSNRESNGKPPGPKPVGSSA